MFLKKVLLAASGLALALSLGACGGAGDKAPEPVNPASCTYEEMVDYLTESGFIAEDAEPIDMLTTEGYVTDNTGGQLPTAPFADKAEDFDGLWLMWWDPAPSEAYENCFVNLAANNGVVVYQGGAAILETDAVNGNFAIAFGDGYAQQDEVLEAFQALSAE